LLAGALVFAACGGNDSKNATVAKDTSADKDADAAAGTDVDTNFSGKGGKEFCDYLKVQTQRDLAIDGTQPIEEQQKQAKETLVVLDALADKAPGEIAADVKLVVQSTKLYFIALADGKQLTPEQMTAIAGTAEQKKSNAEATARINAYGEKVCGVKTDNGSPANATTTTTGG
jgi:hypothetical protein